jgi:hypothetical protein
MHCLQDHAVSKHLRIVLQARRHENQRCDEHCCYTSLPYAPLNLLSPGLQDNSLQFADELCCR